MMIILVCIIWFVLGVVSIGYWMTTKYDLMVNDIPYIILIGFGGPITFVIGWFILGKPILSNKVLFKKKGRDLSNEPFNDSNSIN